MVVAPSALTSLARRSAVILPFSATMVSASRMCFSMAPESTSPIFRITSLLGPAVWGSSWAIVLSFWFNAFAGRVAPHLERGLTAGSSWIIHLYTNDCIRMSKTGKSISGERNHEQLQSGKRCQRSSLDRHIVQLHHYAKSVVPLSQR